VSLILLSDCARSPIRGRVLGTIAIEADAPHSLNDFSLAVKTQTKSEFEILALAMRTPRVHNAAKLK
jgi:hypothetical protein